jgi:hypothetical protein
MHNDSSSLPPPLHPTPPRGQKPDLDLAGGAGFNMDSGASFQPMPDPARPVPVWPMLHGSPQLGGIDPMNVVPDLNLAGVDGAPTPQQLTTATLRQDHQPDFGLPDPTQPTLHPYNLVDPGLDLRTDEFAPDPALPDLLGYHHPYGLDIHAIDSAHPFASDPVNASPTNADLPTGLALNTDPAHPEAILSNLRDPQMTPEIHMSSRPAELAPDALALLHQQPLYLAVEGVPYDQVYSQQAGINTHQRRHNDLLMRGLNGEDA